MADSTRSLEDPVLALASLREARFGTPRPDSFNEATLTSRKTRNLLLDGGFPVV